MKKKEQFNLALWDRLKKDNIPHSFETMDGKEVTQVVFFNCNDIQPILGVFNKELESWDDYGFYNDDAPNPNNLFIVWEEEQLMLEGWMNVYIDGTLFHATKEDANQNAFANRIACVHVSIPYTKGEGLGDGK